jgi:hypothetical protein
MLVKQLLKYEGLSLENLTDADINTTLIRTILKLYDMYEAEIEYEDDQKYDDQGNEDEENYKMNTCNSC